MNWYEKSLIKEASPLPTLQQGEYSRSSYGLQDVDKYLSQEEADKMSKEKLSLLGVGGNGIAWESGNTAIKLTVDELEKRNAKIIMNKQKLLGVSALPFVVGVYSIREIPPHLDRIEIEKVTPLDMTERRFFEWFYGEISGDSFSLESASSRMAAQENKNGFEKIIFAIKKLCNCLKEYNIDDVDIFSPNVGWRGNDLVILDLGAIDFP